MNQISIIVSVDDNNCIGGDNKLLWKQKNDLKRFKELTLNKVIVMGQKTYESLPFKPLKNRINIVVSNEHDVSFEGCIMAYSISDAIEKMKYWGDDKEMFVIGGGSIYEQFLKYANKLYITKIDAKVTGDTYFPKIDSDIWELINVEKYLKDDDNQYDYAYETYELKK